MTNLAFAILCVFCGMACTQLVTEAQAGEALDRIRERGIILVATDPVWPPISWRRDDGEFDGFDVDVAKEIARRMGVDIEFVTPTWEEITAGHWGGRWDLSVGSMTPTEKRAENLEFPTHYYFGMSVLVVHQDNQTIRVPADASGKKIGVLKASVYEKYLTREPLNIVGMMPIQYKIEQPIIVSYEWENEVYDALAKGDGIELDAMIGFITNAMHEIRQGRPLKIIGTPLQLTPSSLAIEPGDPEFAALLRQIVEGLREDGTLSRLSVKWFEFDLTKTGS